MNAWLITWEGTSEKLNDENRLFAIIGARRSIEFIVDILEFLYLRASSNASEMAYLVTRPRKKHFKAEMSQLINGVPHGDRILCGHNPWLYARKVTELNVVIAEESGAEHVTWREPPIFKWTDQSKMNIEIAQTGEIKSLIRSSDKRVSRELDTFYI